MSARAYSGTRMMSSTEIMACSSLSANAAMTASRSFCGSNLAHGAHWPCDIDHRGRVPSVSTISDDFLTIFRQVISGTIRFA
jgi:hypothetical protein